MITLDEQQDMIEDCMKQSERLSEWEFHFIVSIEEYTGRGGFLSERQATMLHAIWANMTREVV